jgi:hypothetical protein
MSATMHEAAMPGFGYTPGRGFSMSLPNGEFGEMNQGFTKRELACIMLKVPSSGLEWLDTLIILARQYELEKFSYDHKEVPTSHLEALVMHGKDAIK